MGEKMSSAFKRSYAKKGQDWDLFVRRAATSPRPPHPPA